MPDFLIFATEPFGTWGPGPGSEILDLWETTWAQSLLLSLGVGGFFTWVCVRAGRRRIRKAIETDVFKRGLSENAAKQEYDKLFNRLGSVPGWMTGVLERAFFTFAVAVDPPAAITAMPVWLALKLAANWQRAQATEHSRSAAFLAVAVGFVAMGFALLGGLTWRGRFGDPPIWVTWAWLLWDRLSAPAPWWSLPPSLASQG